MRIAVAGFLHESHSFAPHPTEWANFLTPGGLPALQRPGAMMAGLKGTSTCAGGGIEEAVRHGASIAPLGWCFANPAGPVTREAFERISAMIVDALSVALEEAPLDGIFLDLHGAMVSDDYPDAEGELMRRVRAAAGAIPVAVTLDPHANMTRQMAELADVIVPYRTYPHVDMLAVGQRAMALLIQRIQRGAPWAMAFRELDFLIPITSQCTMVEPMAGVMAERLALAASVVELAYCFGFPYADFPGCGQAIAAYAETPDAASAAAEALSKAIGAREASFAGAVQPADAAVSEAIRIAAASSKPVVIADTQDNPGGGGHGDTTGLLAELIAQNAQGAVLAPMNDAESAAACHAAGEGATITLALGGKSDAAPLTVTGIVEKLGDGRFTLTGPMGKGNPADLGPSALLRIGGVRVVIVSRKMQAHDQSIFQMLGVEPAAQKILAVKSSVHFRAHFQPIAEAVLVAAAPGPVVADPATLPFTALREDMRLRPGDNRRFGWQKYRQPKKPPQSVLEIPEKEEE
ncbi:M81 family metallopeptidase [Sediminicoccus sp. KRV36]|uniref:M81 family metallopeptidase n=1 Tax=Sediminicoccus sp. KRV36 TaxID=3133721 RepID=UPI00200DD130|nr:M81 family metallopeptidase [Sediminicoccus rosea]UPY34899.1 M81 family metallopeptidase [Sediminicoccus rosea]